MSLGEFIPSGNTKLLLHLNGSSTDSSGNGNNGTDTSITYSQANGRFGQGAGFNGSSSKIAGSITQPTSAYTVSMWLKNNGLSSDSNYRLFDTQNTGGGTNGAVFAYNPSKSLLRVYHNNGSWVSSNNLGGILDTGYNLVVAVWSGTVMSFYVNGNYVGGGAYTTAITNDGGYYIGAGRASVTWWNGAIDEVIVENYAWTAQQVKKHFTYAKGRFGI